VLSDADKRTISVGVFALGVFGGLWGCGIFARGAFVMGANDSLPEILAVTFAFATPLPTFVFALWQPVKAGLWLIFTGLFFPCGMIAQRAYLIEVRHFPDQPTVSQDMLAGLPYTCVLVGFGLFYVLTGLWKWPRPLRRSID
jgi:hypothetical protein